MFYSLLNYFSKKNTILPIFIEENKNEKETITNNINKNDNSNKDIENKYIDKENNISKFHYHDVIVKSF